MKPHPEEVDDVKWVTLQEMDEMMQDEGAFSCDARLPSVAPCVAWGSACVHRVYSKGMTNAPR